MHHLQKVHVEYKVKAKRPEKEEVREESPDLGQKGGIVRRNEQREGEHSTCPL